MEKVSVVCFLASYLVATVIEFLQLRGRNPSRRILMLLATGAGFFAQTMYLLVRSRDVDLPPLMASSHDWLLVLAWVVVLLYLFVTMLEKELSIGYFVLPVVLLVVISAIFASMETSTFVSGDNP